ncbi:MAG TPA: tetratricopeptide repeat protein [Myxococcota bacterium]|jgi:tetratricopeptide (TPR) repeat protein|nr:tetratricopeptide repeat protein [Myxococcota bacterium]
MTRWKAWALAALSWAAVAGGAPAARADGGAVPPGTAGVAGAPGAAGPAPASGPAEDAKARARGLYLAAEERYRAGDYAAALDLYRAAFAAVPEPTFLFDMAQCYRLAGQPAHALRMYEAYLLVRPDAPNRAEVERIVAKVEGTLPLAGGPPSSRLGASLAAAPGAGAASPAALGDAAGARRGARGRGRALWWVAALGGGAVAGAGVTLLVAVLAGGRGATDRFAAEYPGMVVDLRRDR